MLRWLKSFLSLDDSVGRADLQADAGASYGPVTRDTQAAISELSRLARNNPDAVEIYLALGNLYRSHGEIERAVHIRQSLIVRPGLDAHTKGKAWYELGKDYKRGGFVDRSLAAFEKARSLSGDSPDITRELARLTAQGGDYRLAARHWAQLGNTRAEAHYHVLLSRERLKAGDESGGRKALERALKVHPGSPEAWLETLLRDARRANWPVMADHLEQALSKVERGLGFVLLEGILAAPLGSVPGESRSLDRPFCVLPDPDMAGSLLPVLEGRQEDLLLHYYAAWLACGRDRDRSRTLLEKCLVLHPGFWPARLELLALGIDDQPLSPAFRKQLEFFISRAREVKRFLCGQCGLKREQVFFVCPRCQSWHSITPRMALTD